MERKWFVAFMLSASISVGMVCIKLFADLNHAQWDTTLYFCGLAIITTAYSAFAASRHGLLFAVIACPMGCALGHYAYELLSYTPNWHLALIRSLYCLATVLGYGFCCWITQPKKS